jgi:hypothetical protein
MPKKIFSHPCMILYLLLFFSLTMLCSCCLAQTRNTPNLSINAQLNKSTYIWGEPIIVTVTIKNTGKEPITNTWFSSALHFKVDLQNDKGEHLQTLFRSPGFGSTPEPTAWRHTLLPGESITTRFDLLRGDPIDDYSFFPRLSVFSPVTDIYSNIYYVRDLKSGSFTIQVSHDPDGHRRYTPALWIKSAIYKFTIKPADSVQQQALKLFEAPLDLYGRDRDKKRQNTLVAFDQVWRKYPDTPYAPYAIYYQGRIFQDINQYGDALAKYDLLLRRYPNFPLKVDLLYYQAIALRDAKQPARAKIAAQYLNDHFKNHLVSPNASMPLLKAGGKVKGSRIINLAKEMGIKTAE